MSRTDRTNFCFCFAVAVVCRPLSRYVVTLLAALAEIPGMVTTSYLVDRIGRKKTKAVMFTVGGIATFFLSMSSLPFGLLTLAAVVARGSVLGAFNDLYVITISLSLSFSYDRIPVFAKY